MTTELAAPALDYTVAEMAKILRCAESTVQEKARRLHKKHGFPSKIPGLTTWSRIAVEAWYASNGGQAGDLIDEDALIAAQREALDATIGQAAAGQGELEHAA